MPSGTLPRNINRLSVKGVIYNTIHQLLATTPLHYVKSTGPTVRFTGSSSGPHLHERPGGVAKGARIAGGLPASVAFSIE